MNKYYQAIINTSGDAKALSRVQVLDNTGDIVTIYADKSGTRFTDATGANVNYCEADATGMVEFYWTAASDQTLQVLDSAGELERSIADFANNFSEPEVTANVDAVLGVTASDGDLGTFTGSIIPASSAVKTALQALETASDNLKPFTDLAAFKAQPVTNEVATLKTSIGGVNYSWLVGDYSAITPEDDVYIKSDNEALTVGVWKREAALSAPTGAEMVFTPYGSVADRLETPYNIMKYLSPVQRTSAISGDLSVDMTAAFQAACIAERVLYLGDLSYRVDGKVSVPVDGLLLVGAGDGFTITRVAENNADHMFHGTALTGPFGVSNGELIGNVVRGGPGYTNTACAFRIDGGPSVVLDNYRASGFVVGAGPYFVDEVIVTNGCHITGNILTAISGVANNAVIELSRFHDNGYPASGATHEIYLLNSSRVIVRNNRIGPHGDPTSSGINFRYDKALDTTGFDECADWDIHGNVFDEAGCRAAPDPSASTAEQKPNRNINHSKNTYINGAWARFDEPENVASTGNVGLEHLTVTASSTYPGYVMGFLSDKDEVKQIRSNVANSLRATAKFAIIFQNSTIKHGAGDAFDIVPTFGGNPAYSVIEPNLIGTGAALSAAVLTRYQVSTDLNFKSSMGLRWLNRDGMAPTVIAGGGTFTPDNTKSGADRFYARFSGSTATIAAPATARDGMTMDLWFRQAYGGGVTTFTFGPEYKLTSATAAVINTSNIGGRIGLSFLYDVDGWYQVGDASWAS